METTVHSAKFLRHRKFLMMIPLLVIPFLVMIFVALGGGKGPAPAAVDANGPRGLNPRLPDAHFGGKKPADKLAYYEQAAKDSGQWQESLKQDPFFHSGQDNELKQMVETSNFKYKPGSGLNTYFGQPGEADRRADKIMEKLSLLKKEMAKNEMPLSLSPKHEMGTLPSDPFPAPSIQSEQMEKMLSAIKEPQREDPEMNQLSQMLDKVLKIQQQPAALDSPLASKVPVPLIYPVSANQVSTDSIPNETGVTELAGFYELQEDSAESVSDKNKAMEAIIPENQTLVSGSTVKLRLISAIYIHGTAIPAGQFIYGIASLNNERLRVSINSIRSGNNLLPVSLDVYDMDGLQGIYIPGSIGRDVEKQSADQAIGSLGIASLDPSLGAQAASAGIQAAKTLMSKKVRLIRVTVESGYRVLLRDNNQK